MTTTTLPAPTRIGTIQYLKASVAQRLGLEPEHPGADAEWAELLHAIADDKPAPQPLPAIAAAPHREVVDEHLGVLRIASQEPARLYAAMVDERDMTGAFPVVAVTR